MKLHKIYEVTTVGDLFSILLLIILAAAAKRPMIIIHLIDLCDVRSGSTCRSGVTVVRLQQTAPSTQAI
jgi:hypothetical protein